MALSEYVLARMKEEFGSHECCCCGAVANRLSATQHGDNYYCHGCFGDSDLPAEDDGPRVFKMPALFKSLASDAA